MKIFLLSHERELKKPTNTGRIVKECLASAVEIIVWKRTEPCTEIVELIDHNKIALLFPDPDNDGLPESLHDFDNFIILDGTWQEARKMFNRSSYLQRASRVSLGRTKPSQYRLRRNQIANGLSTAECAIELLRHKGQDYYAEIIEQEFNLFNAK